MDDIGGNGNACGLHVFSVYLGDERPIQPDQNMGGEVPVRTGILIGSPNIIAVLYAKNKWRHGVPSQRNSPIISSRA